MDIKEFSLQLQNLYDEMGKTFKDFQHSSGLSCLSGCSKCCLNPEVEATPYEMIPMALKIYEDDKLEATYEELLKSEVSPCIILKDGKCSLYHQRPSICRMFGAAAIESKDNKKKLSLCKFIKEEIKNAGHEIPLPPEGIPLITEWSRKLTALHPELNNNRQQINHALRIALEKVALLMNYQDKSDSYNIKIEQSKT